MTFPIAASSWIRFEQPWWLAAAAAAVLPAAVAMLARRRGRHVGAFCLALQCASLALAAAALARPELALGQRADRPWMVLLDVSASVRGQCDRPLDWPADLRRESYDFAGAVSAAGGLPARAAPASAPQLPGEDQTYAAPALQLAAGRAGEIAGLVLLTDGQFQDADWAEAAEAVGRAHRPVFIVPLDSPPPDARIAELSAQRRSDDKVDLRVTVVSNAVQKRVLQVLREGGAELLRREFALLPGEPASIRLTDDPPADRAATYRAALSGGDAFAQNDAAAASVLPSRQTVALVGKGDEGIAPGLAKALSVPLKTISPGSAPVEAAGWTDFAAVVLVDAVGDLLAPAQRAALGEYVRGGGGLVLVGAGPHGSPGDRDDPLNRVAALIANPYERRPLKVAVVLDASGSMSETSPEEGAAGGQIKFDLAVEAVLSLRRHLTARDALAVVTFSDSPRLVYDSKAAACDFGALREAMGRVRPAGGTKVMPALALAAENTPPKDKEGLVLLVSDLLTEPYDARAVDQAEAIFRRGPWSLSIVAVRTAGTSQPARTSLQSLAEKLQATMVTRDSLTGLAEVFAGFLRSARGDAVRRGQFKAVLAGTPLGVANLSLPELDAYILSAAQEGAEVLASVEGNPVLAERRVALGRSVALAAPLAAGENAALRGSDSLGALLAAGARWAGREQSDPRFRGWTERAAGRLHLRMEAQDEAGPMNLLKLTAEVRRLREPADGTGRTEKVPLVQTAPGRYEADVAAANEPLGLVVTEQGAGQRVVYRQAVAEACPPEFAGIGPNWENLRRLAELSGGEIVSAGRVSSLSRQWDRRRFTSVWPYVLAAALGMVLLEWSANRIWRRG